MNLARAAFFATAFGFSAACATADPATESAAQPEPAIIKPIRVGGPCAYETTEIAATVAQVTDSIALMTPPDGRNFGIGLREFVEKGAMPEAGKVYRVTKRAITTGTCVPVIYVLIGPATDEVPAVPEN